MKIGDRVKLNNKYGLEKKFEKCVFIVASDPRLMNGKECVKLEGIDGVWLTDGLTVVEAEKNKKSDEIMVEYIYEELYKPLLKRFRHLLESKFIASFDEIDPITKNYKRDIAEADFERSNMLPKFVFSGIRVDNEKKVEGSNLIQGTDSKGGRVCFIANSKDTFDAQTDSDGNIEITKAIMYKVWPQTVSCKMYMEKVGRS